ncbi:multidrug resistance-associated protein 1 isoform X2 [Pimephales promelas]|uniref:multidrug resistance-associated protein 1 isoform X2 n=1 Tax=Pimephales promelas TaxID=90988 RepID=UPI0019555CDA|nr:multidrug resistance-associated protein 1 isoform X2 [Pimephales promelas]KAG1943928.1 multidrug resistance-associated protein 1-like [Pimephales promelas]
MRVVVMGHRGPGHLSDLIKLYNEDSVHTLCSVFEREWEKQQNYSKRSNLEEDSGRELLLISRKANGYSLLYAIWMTFHPALVKVVLLRVSTDLFSILGLLTLRWVILFCERQAVFNWAGYTHSLVVLGAVCCCAVSQHQFDKHSRIITANAQAVLACALYRKTVSFSHSSQRQYNTTQWTDVLGQVECVPELVVTLTCLWSCPLRVTLYLCLLWGELGPGVLVGVLLLLVLIPVNSAVEHKAKQLRKTQQIIRKRSEQLIKEMLHNYQALKLLAWESWFHQRVTESRARELEVLRILGYLTAFSMLDSICMPFLVGFSSLGVFVLVDDGNVLTPSQIFTCLCFFRLLRPPLLELPGLLCVLKQAQQSLCHLEKIFLTEDLGTSQLFTTKGATEDIPPDSPQQPCDGYKDELSNSDEKRDHSLFQKGSGETHRVYLRAFGWHWVSVTSLVYLSVCAVSLAQDAVLSVWTGEAKEVQGLEEWRELRNSRLSAYALLGLLQALLVCCAAYCLTCGSLRASHTLHSELLSDVFHLPVHSQKTDARWSLQSFTQDMQVVDEELAKHLHCWLRSLLDILSTITLIIYIMPVFSLAVCPLIMLFLRIQSNFSSDNLRIRHIEANPVVSVTSLECVKHCVEVPLSGPKHREVCLTHCFQASHQNLLVKYNKTITESWAVLQFDGVAGIVLFLVSLILLETQSDSGLVALALICAFNIKEALRRYPQAASDINIDMLSLQRFCEFAKVEKEAEWTVTHRPPFDWPRHGEVKFRNYESEASFNCTPALRGINLTILKGEKIGVISRRKADTDSLVSCLFRTVEARSGAVLIDNVNITRMRLHDLRSRLQIISQVPVLFSGPLRANLDPFAQHTDAQVWLALEICHLKERVQQLPAQLLHPVQRTSLTFSFGQRRLLCLARALLARVKILLVEEALPSVDIETEGLVRQLIHTAFKDCTVLWLTQNPLTVMHTDRVLVLNNGQAVKFDAPSTVFQQGPLFSQ